MLTFLTPWERTSALKFRRAEMHAASQRQPLPNLFIYNYLEG